MKRENKSKKRKIGWKKRGKEGKKGINAEKREKRENISTKREIRWRKREK